MPLKKNYDLSTGDFSQFSDGETDPGSIGTLVTTTPMCASNNYYYSIAWVNGSAATYLADTVPSYKAFRGTFKLRIDNSNVVNSARTLRVLECNGASVYEFTISFVSAVGGELETVSVKHRNSSSTLITTNETIPAGTIDDDTTHTIDFHWQTCVPGTTNTGIIRVWIDDVLWVNEQAIDVGASRAITEIKMGVASDVSVTRTIDVGCLQLSTNGDYTTSPYIYYIDSDATDDTGDGSVSDPFKYAIQANQGAVAGDTIRFATRSASNPHRLIDMGQVCPINSGTAGNVIAIDSADVQDGELLCSRDYTEASWVESTAQAGEYYLNVNEIDTDPHRIYVCLKTAWAASGINALTETAIRNAGTVGSLAVGEYDYGDNDTIGFNTIYYRPAAGELITTIHIEVPRSITTNDNGLQIDTDYTELVYMQVRYAVLSNIVNASNGTGSKIIFCSGLDAWNFGISTVNADVVMSFGSWTRSEGDGIHGNGVGGTGDVWGCITHNNANDGISFASSHTSKCYYNSSFNNGYEAAGDNSGIEVTGNAVIECYNNTLVGNYGAGYFNQSTVAAGQVCTNNISAYNGSNNYHVSATHATSLMDGNASYDPNTNDFYIVGTGSVSPSDTVLTDPLFVTVDTTKGMTTNNNNRADEDYHLQETSPCVGTAAKWWGNDPRPNGPDGESAPDTNLDFGAYQSTWDANHPANL